jgi:hypothetical protein
MAKILPWDYSNIFFFSFCIRLIAIELSQPFGLLNKGGVMMVTVSVSTNLPPTSIIKYESSLFVPNYYTY